VSVYFIAATTIINAYGSYKAGEAQEAQYEAQARQAESDATTQLVERKRALIETMAAQNVGAAAQGRTISSISTLQEEDVRRAGYDSLLIKAGGSATASAARSAGQSAKQQGYLKASSTLLSGASNVGMLSAPAKKAD